MLVLCPVSSAVERLPHKRRVTGSKPVQDTTLRKDDMQKVKYDLAMYYLDKIEEALDTIAIAVGHPTMAEFFAAE
jgi:hypothetical protein